MNFLRSSKYCFVYRSEIQVLYSYNLQNSYASTLAKNATLELQISIGIITKFCQDALKILNEVFTSSDELQVKSLDAVAKARYALGMTAEFLYLSCVSDDEKWRKHETRGALELLFNKVQALCTCGHSRSPALYLLKQLVKRYGGHCIATISQHEELSWIVPAEFQQRQVRCLFHSACYIMNACYVDMIELQVDSLDAVAEARYTLGMTAEFLYLSCVNLRIRLELCQ